MYQCERLDGCQTSEQRHSRLISTEITNLNGAFGTPDQKEDTPRKTFLSNYREVRHISEFKETFDAGKFRLPVSMLHNHAR
ncbi:uncharacterized protein ACA1_363170 [Acanthamoeba castellanii str. Neff]|uniref:Uncharacterized protein n=1 Tax=Acanthamoeba castellanii (strain ATCC 30010 / Neff) TaxID=1257118 RepID=L8GGE3_ACACF|nr:uncharacterized protein ACA1_363170 [Acanthamoeba castellanii str. Neff]ELR11818.1 hypothetical protein ACA1_363170 [Acanthamoeba castellanii str. Neff]